MEEEKVINLSYKFTKTTAEFLLKTLFSGIDKGYEIYNDIRLGKRIFHGETEWNKFMESLDPTTIKDLQTNEVSLEKFKEELEKYGIGFAFYKHSDGRVSVAYSIKHESIVSKALSETIEKMVKDDGFSERVKKKEKNMNFEEKLNHFKNKEKAKTTEEPKFTKEASRGEKTK